MKRVRVAGMAAVVVLVSLIGCVGADDEATDPQSSQSAKPSPVAPGQLEDPTPERANATAPDMGSAVPACRAEVASEATPAVPPCQDAATTLRLSGTRTLEGSILVPQEYIEPYLPDGFAPADIFMGDPYPAGTTGIYPMAFGYGNGSLDGQALSQNGLVYWGFYVVPPPAHEGRGFQQYFILASVFAGDLAVAAAFDSWGVGVAVPANVSVEAGDPSVAWHSRAEVTTDAFGFTLDFVMHGGNEAGGTHQTKTPRRLFAVEDRQVVAYIDEEAHGAPAFFTLGAIQVTYPDNGPIPPAPYPWSLPSFGAQAAEPSIEYTFVGRRLAEV